MDQVSLPMRIALLVVLAFAGLWFAALRPKPPTADPVAAPTPAPKTAPKAAKGTTSAPKQAKAAVDKAGKAATSKAAATPATAKADPATAKADPATAAKPAEAAKAPAPAKPADDRPAALQRVLKDLDAKRTTVLLFWDRKVADDREVRRAVGDIDRHGGKVRVHVNPIAKVGIFEPVTRNVPVVTSPTVLIIGKDRRARAVEGLTLTSELDELVVKALNGR